ncbi:hypothetical protein HDV03_000930 [Kappamyces sp. JEL0829]|nr:hypothetical protein HDV03_000930 [Kappamyces sp. JEL0829]
MAQTATTTTSTGVAPFKAPSVGLNAKQLDDWNKIFADSNNALSGSFSDCAGEVNEARKYVEQIYGQYKLGSNFFQALTYVQSVAGDIDQSKAFIGALSNFSTSMQTYYNQTIATEYSKWLATSSSLASYTSASLASVAAAKETTVALVPSGLYSAGPVAEQTNAPHAYGAIVSGASSVALSAAGSAAVALVALVL